MPRASISASTSLRLAGSDVARFLLSTNAIPSSLVFVPEMKKSPGGHTVVNRLVAAEAPSPPNLAAVYTVAGRKP